MKAMTSLYTQCTSCKYLPFHVFDVQCIHFAFGMLQFVPLYLSNTKNTERICLFDVLSMVTMGMSINLK